jgi:FixJ family two-component response regulator
LSPAPSPDHPQPGDAASRVRDADLPGLKVVDCEKAATRYRLTPRQRGVLLLSLCDNCPKTIARTLGLKTSYVRIVRQNVVRKLRVQEGMSGIRRRIADIAREQEDVAEEKP